MKAINIKWDTNEDERESLPDEICIPKEIQGDDEISDYLSDKTGYCHLGYDLVMDNPTIDRMKEMINMLIVDIFVSEYCDDILLKLMKLGFSKEELLWLDFFDDTEELMEEEIKDREIYL